MCVLAATVCARQAASQNQTPPDAAPGPVWDVWCRSSDGGRSNRRFHARRCANWNDTASGTHQRRRRVGDAPLSDAESGATAPDSTKCSARTARSTDACRSSGSCIATCCACSSALRTAVSARMRSLDGGQRARNGGWTHARGDGWGDETRRRTVAIGRQMRAGVCGATDGCCGGVCARRGADGLARAWLAEKDVDGVEDEECADEEDEFADKVALI